MSLLLSMMLFLAALVPTKSWFAPAEPINVGVKAPADVSLFLTDFTGRSIESQGSVSIGGGERTVDLKALFPTITTPGTYVLYLVPKDAATKDFAGTPLVVSVREDRRQGAPPGPMVVRLSPLRFAMLTTEKGPPLTIAFYYDVAPHTTENFLSLAEGGFYDGLTFHRIVKDFVLQGGDPRGDGTGGPGYTVNAEFNERPHHEGVLSMARGGDPNEAGGAMPRAEFANSAGSQFFVCLNYANTQQLDRRYTAFAKIVTGTEAVQALAAVPLAEGSDRPKDPPKIVKVEVRPVTAQENPYPRLIEQIQPNLIKAPTSAPTSSPTSSPAEAPPRAP